MKEVIEKLKEKKIDKRLNALVEFSKITKMSQKNPKACESALKNTFLDMIFNEEEEFADDIFKHIVFTGVDILFKELGVCFDDENEDKKGYSDEEIKTVEQALDNLLKSIFNN